MMTGLDRDNANNLRRIAESLEHISETLENLRWQMVKDHEQRERHANTNDNARR
jgi:hypothetical protein